MKMGHESVENFHVQKVLFPLLDYCTDIYVPNRADTLLEDGLRLWLVTLVSSRLATMRSALSNVGDFLFVRVCVVKWFHFFHRYDARFSPERCYHGSRPSFDRGRSPI